MPFNLNAVKLLTNNELWFAKPDIQNDPNEAEFIIRYDKEVKGVLDFRIIIQEKLNLKIDQTDSGKKSPTGFERLEFEKELKKVVREYLGICSFSVKYDHILMWAHYTDNNKGICIVFDKEILTNCLSKESGKVSYSQDISNANFEKNGTLGHIITDKVFYMDKLKIWDSEEEYRFVKRFNDRIPQANLERLVPFPDDAVVGIILGEKFPKENFKTLINLAYLRNPSKEFYFWRCEKNLHKKAMNIVQISDKHVNIYLSQEDYPLEHILKWARHKLKAKHNL